MAEQAEAHGERLWEREPDLCCALRKVAPLRQALEGMEPFRGTSQEPRRQSGIV